MASPEQFFLAPLQGFTDFAYRKSYHSVFGGFDAYFIPYLSLGPGNKIRNSQYREVLPQNNQGIPVVPQILCSNVAELTMLATIIRDFGYEQLNLNLGCPYPMATNRGRGSALLEKPDELKRILDALFSDFNFKVSLKFRAGMTDERSIFQLIDLLKSYPTEQLIFHPRTANQLYKGTANRELFAEFSKELNCPLTYNGDIQSPDDLDSIKQLLPEQNSWMIGRGLLSNPFLLNQLNNTLPSKTEQTRLKTEFHDLILEEYQRTFPDEGQVLMKMKAFWSYFSQSFSNPQKAFKPIKKASSFTKFKAAYPTVFQQYAD
ncbi:tRNA dihydrouridine synthase [Mangrovibacterium sp.]|uniref:tRNA dihydrouridine synthase n=1 Tax=Mangrovibacterium sp. TaxID=1961364 RepID=UPI003568BC05